MILTGALGSFFGLLLRDPGATLLGSLLLLLFCLFGKTYFFKFSLATRLSIEGSILILLLAFSSFIWTPSFYFVQADRCDVLTLKSREAIAHKPESRVALDREVAWFERRARKLRWKGWWLGLTLGPATRDDSTADIVDEFGTLESIERHEKRMKVLLEAP
jgi:hypothetical protein